MMVRKYVSLFLALVIMAAGGCAPVPSTLSADVVKSSEPRNTEVSVPPEDVDALVAANGEFAFDLYRHLASDGENLFYSPHSISVALAMTYAGARGETEQAMGEAMNRTLSQDRLHPAFNYLDMELSSRGEGAEGKDDEGFRLNVVNAIWGQKGYSFLSDYLDTLAVNYGAGLRVLDFEQAPEESRVVINDWVEEQTEDRIQDLIPQGAIDALTRLVLTNAVYFNAAWESQFEERDTNDGDFHLLDGNVVEVPMMKQTAWFRHADYEDYAAIELPYDGGELSMVVLMPDEGKFEEFEESLDFSVVQTAIDGLSGSRVVLTMPRFGMETSFNLKDALSTLGMGTAFEPDAADFSGMDGTQDLYITDVVHKAFVEVDEAGTEAAAATAVVVGATSAPTEPVEFTIDRPFVFLIRDIQTGSILFLGRVVNPG
ncbi:MAG: serpin family protein [Chloroflexota bacterium]